MMPASREAGMKSFFRIRIFSLSSVATNSNNPMMDTYKSSVCTSPPVIFVTGIISISSPFTFSTEMRFDFRSDGHPFFGYIFIL